LEDENMIRAIGCVLAALLPLAVLAQAPLSLRLEMRAVDSVTLSAEQFLLGDEKSGKRVMLAGELRIPGQPGTKVPAVILVHGSGGISGATDAWARELNAIGVAAFILDTFSGRGIISTVADQSQLNSLAMMVDSYRALAHLAEHPRIDRNRIAIMGFSKGAVASVYSANERFRKIFATQGTEFAAHIGLYTPCNIEYQGDDKTTGKPIRLFHGTADDYVPIGPCRTYVERLKKAGADVRLTDLADAHHAYDNPAIPVPTIFAANQTTRNCTLKEGDNGSIINVKTGKPYDLSDACVEKGPPVGYNAAAHQATLKAVREFLTATFRL
jgi:dienelactone hydrolase